MTTVDHLWRHFTPAGAGHIVIERGEGCYIWDSEGKRYLDALSALYCVNIGYGPWPEIAEAAKRQVEELPFFSNWVGFEHEPALALADKLTRAPADRRRPDLLRRRRVRGDRVGAQDRAPVPPAARRADADEVRHPAQRLPRDDARRALHQREPGAARAVRAAAARLLPRADAVPLPLPVLRGEARLHAPVRRRDRRHRPERGPRDRRGGDPRAGAELGRLDRAAAGLLRPRPRDLRRERAPARRRRGHLRLRPCRRLVRLDALRHRARPDDAGEGDHVGLRAARRRRRLGEGDRAVLLGAAERVHARDHLRRASALVRDRARQHRRLRARGPDRARAGARAGAPRALRAAPRPSTRWSATCAATATSTRSSS